MMDMFLAGLIDTENHLQNEKVIIWGQSMEGK